MFLVFALVLGILSKDSWEKSGILTAKRGTYFHVEDDCYEYSFEVKCDQVCEGYSMNANDIESFQKNPKEKPQKFSTHITIKSGEGFVPISTYQEYPYLTLFNNDEINPTNYEVHYICHKSPKSPKNAGTVVLFVLIAICICCTLPYCTTIVAMIQLSCIVSFVVLLIKLIQNETKKSSSKDDETENSQSYEVNQPHSPPVYSQEIDDGNDLSEQPLVNKL